MDQIEEDPLIKRLKELSLVTHPTEKEFNELKEIKQELGLIDEPKEEYAPIEQIITVRKKRQENAKKQHELDLIKAERKELEIKLNMIKERARLEKVKNQLDGKVFCDDCKKWVWPNHFD